ncbi:MAG: glycoside hydrolase family 2 TIM barrel-domain containing protein, partial [Bacillota bacterium]
MRAFALAKFFTLLLVTIAYWAVPAQAHEGSHANSVPLNGPWQFVQGAGDEHAEAASAQPPLDWQPVTLPGPFMKWSQEAANQTRFVWARRNFTVTPTQAKALAVLRWNRIACGAEAFINGQKVGENEPTGPYQVIVPAGVLKPGKNQIVLKIRGAAAVRKSRSGNALIPAGFGVGIPEVTDDIWIDFADSAYIKWALAMPDLPNSRVKIRITPTGPQPLDNLQIIAQVKPWPDGKTMGTGEAPARLVPDPDPLGGKHFFVEVPMPGFQPWTYEQCPLYTAQVKLTKDGRILDELTFRFGMRQIKVQDRNYKLNGKNLWLHGSNLVFEWNWGDTVRGKEIDYLVTEAREMSMNSFRTHTQPPPRLWCDICDEHGTMILSEFPVLYNYQDYKFTPEEYEIWHRNVLTDSAGWMARLWNHPSVIMWVLSNESQNDNAWESGPFQDFVNALDPTRPTLRTGTTGTRDNYDVHTCGNVTETDEGHLLPSIAGWFQEAGDRTTTNTEYM